MINESPGLMFPPTPEQHLAMCHCQTTIWVKAHYRVHNSQPDKTQIKYFLLLSAAHDNTHGDPDDSDKNI